MQIENQYRKGRRIAGRVLIIMGTLLLLGSATAKFAKIPNAISGLEAMGFYGGRLTFIAMLEVLSAVLYIVPITRAAGLLMVSAYLGGAFATHIQHGQSPFPPAMLLAVVWLGSWLRDPQTFWSLASRDIEAGVVRGATSPLRINSKRYMTLLPAYPRKQASSCLMLSPRRRVIAHRIQMIPPRRTQDDPEGPRLRESSQSSEVPRARNPYVANFLTCQDSESSFARNSISGRAWDILASDSVTVRRVAQRIRAPGSTNENCHRSGACIVRTELASDSGIANSRDRVSVWYGV